MMYPPICVRRFNRPIRIRLSLCGNNLAEMWMSVCIQCESLHPTDNKHQIDSLRMTQAAVKFISIEPLLDDLGQLNLTGIDWVIVGGESGPGARPMQPDWARSIRNQCLEHQIPFFFKQWGGFHKRKAGCVLDGCIWDQMPQSPIHTT